MKTITFIVSSLGSGGAERVTTVLANYFADHNFRVNIIIFNNMYNEYSISPKIHKVFLNSNKNKLVSVLSKTIKLKHILKDQQPDYVISLGMLRYVWLSKIYKEYRCIFSERNDPHQSRLVDLFIKKACFKHAVKVVFQTSDAKAFYERIMAVDGTIIPNPIREDIGDIYCGQRDKRIVTVCRLTAQKNLPLMIQAYRLFQKDFPEYTLEIYGSGELEEDLKSYTKEMGVEDKVIFKGFVNPINQYISSASMFVLSSDYEGISNSMLEAMALGLPTICTDCPIGGARLAIKSYENGILVPVRDVNSLYSAMKFIVENPNASEKMSIAATEVRKRFSTETICNKWMDLLNED